MAVNPQPIDMLQIRYHEAVVEIFDAEEVVSGFATRPGELPKHIFDYEDGLRLIVSRDRLPGGDVVLHISASFTDKTDIHGRLDALAVESIDAAMDWFKALAIERWQHLAMSREQPTFIGLSPQKQIPHWHLPEYREAQIH